jgi:hypothetical protein
MIIRLPKMKKQLWAKTLFLIVKAQFYGTKWSTIKAQ